MTPIGRAAVAAIVVVLVVALVYAWRHSLLNSAYVAASNGTMYAVSQAFPDRRQAAEALAELERRAAALAQSFVANHSAEPGERGEAARRIARRFRPHAGVENSPLNAARSTAYDQDKGRITAMCLRERDPAESGDPATYDIAPMNTLTFVRIHELAHLGLDRFDHPDLFWRTDVELLREAARLGLYRPVDYSLQPARYCGMTLNSNPMYHLGGLA
jgi:hypothetical protein